VPLADPCFEGIDFAVDAVPAFLGADQVLEIDATPERHPDGVAGLAASEQLQDLLQEERGIQPEPQAVAAAERLCDLREGRGAQGSR
jgi:hypothetical protein